MYQQKHLEECAVVIERRVKEGCLVMCDSPHERMQWGRKPNHLLCESRLLHSCCQKTSPKCTLTRSSSRACDIAGSAAHERHILALGAKKASHTCMSPVALKGLLIMGSPAYGSKPHTSTTPQRGKDTHLPRAPGVSRAGLAPYSAGTVNMERARWMSVLFFATTFPLRACTNSGIIIPTSRAGTGSTAMAILARFLQSVARFRTSESVDAGVELSLGR